MATQKTKKLLGNSAIFAVGNLGSKLITFLMVPLFTNYLSTEQFGTVDLATTTVNMLSPIVALSIADAVFRFLMDDESDDQAIFTTGLTFTITVSLVLLFLYPVVRFFHIANGGYILVYLTLVILQALLQNFIRAIEYRNIFAMSSCEPCSTRSRQTPAQQRVRRVERVLGSFSSLNLISSVIFAYYTAKSASSLIYCETLTNCYKKI